MEQQDDLSRYLIALVVLAGAAILWLAFGTATPAAPTTASPIEIARDSARPALSGRKATEGRASRSGAQGTGKDDIHIVRILRDGKALAGQPVDVFVWVPSPRHAFRRRTDAAGEITLRHVEGLATRWDRPTITTPGYVLGPDYDNSDPDARLWTYRVREGPFALGTVVDELTRQPIAGALVVVRGEQTSYLSTQSGARGRFQLPTRDAHWDLQVIVSAPGYCAEWVRFGDQRHMRDGLPIGEIALRRGVEIRGTLEDEQGNPIPGAEIAVYADGYIARTAADLAATCRWRPSRITDRESEPRESGPLLSDLMPAFPIEHRYIRTDLPETNAQGRFAVPRLPSGEAVVVAALTETVDLDATCTRVLPRPDAETVHIQLTTKRNSRVQVRIVGRKNAGLVHVGARGPTGGDARALGDGVEYCTLRVGKGPTVIWATSESRAPAPIFLDVQANEEREISFDLSPPPSLPPVRGCVLDESGARVPDAGVEIQEGRWHNISRLHPKLRTDEDGAFTWSREDARARFLIPTRKGEDGEYAPAGPAVHVDAHATSVVLRTGDAAWQRGRLMLVPPRGGALPAAVQVEQQALWTKGGSCPPLEEQDLPVIDGAILVGRLYPGQALIRVKAEGYASQELTVDVPTAATIAALGTVQLESAHTVELFFEDGFGRRLFGCYVRNDLYKEERHGERLVLKDLPARLLRFRVGRRYGDYARRTLAIDPRKHTRLEVQMARSLHATGQIRLPHGQHIGRGSRVRLTAPPLDLPPGPPICQTRVVEAEVLTDGRFSQILGPGTWQVELLLPSTAEKAAHPIPLGTWELETGGLAYREFAWPE